MHNFSENLQFFSQKREYATNLKKLLIFLKIYAKKQGCTSVGASSLKALGRA
jgi:hypothetical protein